MASHFLKKLKFVFIQVIVLVIILELFSFVAIRWFHFGLPPKVYSTQFLPFFVDNDKTFGVWHYADTTTRHIGPCWNVEYQFNSYGARDDERQKVSDKKRIVFLGDSFIEGYGIDKEKRVSDLMEKNMNMECLNFGVSGSFGTTQMRLLYESKAKEFSHNAVVLSFFPFNDFLDDNYEFGKSFFYTQRRYRPYLVKDSTKDYQLVYHVDALEKSQAYPDSIPKRTAKDLLNDIYYSNRGIVGKTGALINNFTYTGAMAEFIVNRMKFTQSGTEQTYKSDVFSQKNTDAMDLFCHNVNKIKEMAGNKPVIVLLIPHPLDLMEYKKTGKSLLRDDLNKFGKSANIHVVDLLDAFAKLENPGEYFLPCDGHWSEKGNEFVAEVLQKKIQELNL
ncbi:SGNH/GDSL hydrolase family protein [Emticicia agri]|nr:SGNH/GDSL hydrolase family protein [Emticicia agri]